MWQGTVQYLTDLQNLDTSNLEDFICLYLDELNSWYVLHKSSNITADEKEIITANPSGRFKKVNPLGVVVDTQNNVPQNPPERKNILKFFKSSGRSYISEGTSAISDWVELKYQAIRYGSGHPNIDLGLVPKYAGEIFLDTGNNRLFISIDGTNWSVISISDGKTNVFLTASLLTFAPENTGDLLYDSSNQQLYLSTGTSLSSDWKLLKTNQIILDQINNVPQNKPIKQNDIAYFTNSNRLFIAKGTVDINDWDEIFLKEVDIVSSKPSNPTNGERKFSYDSVKKQLYIYDGNDTFLISDIKQKNNHLILDISNHSEYSNFVDIDANIGIQIFWHPLNIPFWYYDGTSIIYYDLTQYSRALWTNTGGTSANDEKAMYIPNTDIENAKSVNGGNDQINLSNFFNTNGCGNYFLIPTMKDESDSTYKSIGNADNTINLGLEFVNNEFNKTTKILDFKYDKTEFNLNTPPSQLSTIRGQFSSYDLASSTYYETLSGGIKFLQITNMPINCEIQLRPYELLTNYSNFYAG